MDMTVPLYTTPDGIKWTRNPKNASAVVLQFSAEPVGPSKQLTYMATDGQTVYMSKDMATWTGCFIAAYENLAGLTSLYMDPTGSLWLLTGAGPRTDELFTSVDDGQTWQRVNMSPWLMELHKTFPVDASTFVNVQYERKGWIFVSRDAGATWTNTSSHVPSVETSWLANSKVLLHFNGVNVTAASINDLSSWTTQKLPVVNGANFVVFKDTFYGINRTSVCTSTDGVNWQVSDHPYYVDMVSSWAVSDDTIFGVGSDGIAVSAQ